MLAALASNILFRIMKSSSFIFCIYYIKNFYVYQPKAYRLQASCSRICREKLILPNFLAFSTKNSPRDIFALQNIKIYYIIYM